MARRLPLELELAIIRLAIPPLISIRRLEERVDLCKTLSLVCRRWTQLAQEELRQHVSLKLRKIPLYSTSPQWDEEKVSKRLKTLKPIRRIHVLGIVGNSIKVTPDIWLLDGTLEHVSLASVWPDCLVTTPFPRLRSVVLADIDLTLCNGNLDVQPALSVLAIVSRTAPFDKQLLKIPRHLKHLAYHPMNADSEHNMDMAECTTFDLPPNLRSFTFVSSVPERYHCLTAIEIGEACKRVGATFVHVPGQRAKDWDAEEWAYSLMDLEPRSLERLDDPRPRSPSLLDLLPQLTPGPRLARTSLAPPPSPSSPHWPLLNSLNETLEQLAVPVTLPIELQHRILETALPPLVRRDLDERVRLCKTFSLVHRSWTPIAQRELHEHFSTTLLGGAWRFSGEYGRFVAAQVGGSPVKRLNLKVIGYAEDVEDTDYADKQPLHPFPPVEGAPTFEEMWVELEGRGTPVWRGGNVRRLHIYDVGPERPTHLDSLPSTLTYLALSGVTVDAVPSAPHVRFFLYSRAVCLVPAADLLGAFQDPKRSPASGHGFNVDDVAHDARPANNANIALPPSLDSCILVESVSTNRKEKRATERLVANACEVVDAAFVYKWMEEVGELDFEEWALSVGA
ncbi:Proteophosphoglycan ppg4 [Rhodotorula toruloides ATCC 204091]|uniref:Proteophosphoglycan ppg4 n=1 Tax=Rhodotorula toruloides TaxID=5286 RepID=A0A0K3CMD8_RHOTO|nr:Proteophosphoglycan ppg4 [Rhodotorula toruloides ATCC 204091]PRQ70843.1 Proteophosphoglycan ppg4 [Rhodotorula toruloides]